MTTMEATEIRIAAIDDYLGPSSGRYFGDGFRRIRHELSEFEIRHLENGSRDIKAVAHISYPADWSTKRKVALVPHLSTIDALALAVQLCETYLHNEHDVTDERHAWLRRFVMKAGATPNEALRSFGVRAVYGGTVATPHTLGGSISTFDCHIGAIKVMCEVEHSTAERPDSRSWSPRSVDAVSGAPAQHYYADGYKLGRQTISDLTVDRRGRRTDALVKIEPAGIDLRAPEGLEAQYHPSVSMIDCITIQAQLAQVLLYHLDGINRAATDTLWMRRVTMESNTPYPLVNAFIASTAIVQSRCLSMQGDLWRTADFVGECQGITTRYSLAHRLYLDEEEYLEEHAQQPLEEPDRVADLITTTAPSGR